MANRCASRSRLIKALCLVTFLTACSAGNLQRAANEFDLKTEVVTGTLFEHRIVRKHGHGGQLHVYIEGDGRPWRNRTNIALDPTPKHFLMLELMAIDPAPAIYVGRPCYFRLNDANCTPEWWTGKRYSQQIVDSLNSVIQQYAHAYDGTVLFGHSGGGALVMLIAAQRSDTLAVVTLAGNLNVDAWATAHRYSLLRDSLNPARQPPLSKNILQRHYLGALDTNVTPDMTHETVDQQYSAELIVVENFDHSCCWKQLWPELLTDLRQELLQN